MSKRNIIALSIFFVFILVGIFVTMYLVSSNQDTRSSASTPDLITTVPLQPTGAFEVADGEEDPGEIDDVTVDYPSITGDSADWDSASCTWAVNPNAASYNLKVSKVDPNTGNILAVVKDESVTGGVSKDIFAVTRGDTYKCEVAAVNTAGVAGVSNFDQQTCIVDGLADPSPTVPPTVTVAPSASPTATLIPTVAVPTSAPKPTLPPTGNIGTVATVGIGGVILMLIGGALLFL